MSKRMVSLVLAGVLVLGAAGFAGAASKLIVYTSMKESLIGQLREAFIEQNPGLDMDYQSAGEGKLMAKIAAERESGKILADVLWTSEVPDFYQLRQQGILEKYVSPETKHTVNPLADFDGSFTPALPHWRDSSASPAGAGPIIFSGRTASSNSSAVSSFNTMAASFSVPPS